MYSEGMRRRSVCRWMKERVMLWKGVSVWKGEKVERWKKCGRMGRINMFWKFADSLAKPARLARRPGCRE